eukprot:797700-Rhodomonas_salina.2
MTLWPHIRVIRVRPLARDLWTATVGGSAARRLRRLEQSWRMYHALWLYGSHPSDTAVQSSTRIE